jgi:hypothetical protein
MIEGNADPADVDRTFRVGPVDAQQDGATQRQRDCYERPDVGREDDAEHASHEQQQQGVHDESDEDRTAWLAMPVQVRQLGGFHAVVRDAEQCASRVRAGDVQDHQHRCRQQERHHG